jgi:hypothetical protein
VEREVDRKYRGNVSHTVELAYGVTSLEQQRASAERLLELNRGHWDVTPTDHSTKKERKYRNIRDQ